MSRPRRWIVSGGLLAAAGALTAVSSWRHWASCRPEPTSPACLALQDATYGLPLWATSGTHDSFDTVLVTLAALLLSSAWFLVAGWASNSGARTTVALAVGLQPLLVALLVDLAALTPGQRLAVDANGWLTWPAEIMVVPLLLGAGWILDETVVQVVRLMLLGWAVTSFGSVHHFVDHVLTSSLLGASVEGSPPGLGYVTGCTQIALGVAVVIISLVMRQGPEPEDDERSGRDGFTLAA